MTDSNAEIKENVGNPNKVFAKIIEENIRTTDVISDVQSFSDLMISPKLCEILEKQKYHKPTPVQEKALPLLLFGTDMLVQAKAGTGKTLVFALLAAKLLHETEKTRLPQVLILAPTREIAKQIYDTIRRFLPPTFWAGLFVGGNEITPDIKLLRKGCQIAIGTCGRISQLLNMKILKLTEVQLFVLDEADKLMEADFVKQINFIFSSMNQEMKQVCVFSATYPTNLEETLKNFMREPTLLRLNVQEEQLVGVKEYCVFCEKLKKADALMILLKKLVFTQCFVFCDTLDYCKAVYSYLLEQEIECVLFGSNLSQEERFKILKQLKNKQIRILVATDLMSRGVDVFGCDLVINLNLSFDVDTHMHRNGRAGRYGGKGIAITILSNEKEAVKLLGFMNLKGLDIRNLDVLKDFPYNLIENYDFHEKSLPFSKHPFFCDYDKDEKELCDAFSSIKLESTTEEVLKPPVEVPARARTRKIYYLRRDFYQIFAGRNEEEWIEYSNQNMTILDHTCISGDLYERPELIKLASEYNATKAKPEIKHS